MATKKEIEKIKKFWDEQALKHEDNYLATIPDKFFKELEIKNILNYFPTKAKKAKILDIGCGNGYATLRYAQEYKKAEIVGVDYSEEMIRQAKKAKAKQKKISAADVNFFTGDILNLNFCDNEFDVVTTDRCLINLISLAHQRKALKEICRIMKKGGKYIMCECTQEGLAKLNRLRLIAKLSIIPNHWHNLYLNEAKLFPYIQRNFKILTIDNFGSTYYIGSRIFNALAAKDSAQPNYLSLMNEVAAKLPPLGDYSPLKIILLEKK